MLRSLMIRDSSLRIALGVCLATMACITMVAADGAAGLAPRRTPPVPAVALPLEDFGFRTGLNPMALHAGYTNGTINFIDSNHLLLTFSARKLMKRSPEQREGDDDHTVRAVVVHLPDGKVVRETEWRMHDRAAYLWPIGGGRFLLRERGNLFSLHPLGSDHPEELGRRLVWKSEDDIQAVQLSPGRDLLLVETTPPARIGDDPDEKVDRPVTAHFYHVIVEGDSVILSNRGRAKARDAFSIAFTSMGVLQTVREDRMHWGFDFHPYKGKNIELGGFTSTCRPRGIFISDAGFFAYGCRGGDDRRLMGGFNLLAEARWVFTIDDPPLWLAVDTSPATGRFAVRNTLTTVPAQEADRLNPTDLRAQEVRVYSSREGDELLRVVCSPEQRPAGNFSLSPDGLKLAVLHAGQLEVYELPPVSSEDRKQHEREEAALATLHSSAEADVGVALTNSVEK